MPCKRGVCNSEVHQPGLPALLSQQWKGHAAQVRGGKLPEKPHALRGAALHGAKPPKVLQRQPQAQQRHRLQLPDDRGLRGEAGGQAPVVHQIQVVQHSPSVERGHMLQLLQDPWAVLGKRPEWHLRLVGLRGDGDLQQPLHRLRGPERHRVPVYWHVRGSGLPVQPGVHGAGVPAAFVQMPRGPNPNQEWMLQRGGGVRRLLLCQSSARLRGGVLPIWKGRQVWSLQWQWDRRGRLGRLLRRRPRCLRALLPRRG
mmetsp:Transcript_40401/g.114390  ORF Transcript_40401/g.114390 Transcript_40401/m.114390 type:complete len:256 (+) Transcript_40401:991-1758(+)